MAMDHEGNHIINEGLKEDKKNLRQKLQTEMNEKYAAQFANIRGTAQLQAQANEAVRKSMEKELSKRYQQGVDELEKMAFGNLGKDFAKEMADREQKIDEFRERQQKAREKGEGVSDRAKKWDYTTSNKFNKENTVEKNFQEARQKLKDQRNNPEEQSKDLHRPTTQMNSQNTKARVDSIFDSWKEARENGGVQRSEKSQISEEFDQKRKRSLGQEWDEVFKKQGNDTEVLQEPEQKDLFAEEEKQKKIEAMMQQWAEKEKENEQGQEQDNGMDI